MLILIFTSGTVYVTKTIGLVSRQYNRKAVFVSLVHGRAYKNYQHEDFHNRVRMLDPSVTNGNGSVIIRNIGLSDAGLYKCSIAFGSRRSKLSEVEHSVNLTVTEQINDSTSNLIDVSVTPRSSKCPGRHPCVVSSSLLLLIIILVTL